ncbi:hypothetical protein E1262_00520 [Jiangella aurantiaca]|uniref:Uncharacterized protein n=1 Tax=Jiangella aurantiaca TaxID=2530373 RepID=A0A4R5AK59_9ACTN|nr:hypothetical protein [Jiangella aurantiaca]TDD73011.1 hypothetical protein E1262_00520 [Jiangella aurantiaca]
MRPDEGGGEYTSIDVDALGQAVDDLGATLTGLTDHISGLESDFGYFGVDKSNLNKLLEAKSDLESIMPDMRRRHSLAVQLLAQQQTNGWAGDGVLTVQGTDILNDDFDSVEDAQNAGRELAEQVNNGDGEVPPEVYEQLERYGHDPDFAEAFINNLSPESRGFLLIDADNQATAYGDEANPEPQLAVATVFATASFRIDYNAEFIGGINQALLDKGLHPDGIRIVDRISALTQHGSWDHGSLVAFSEAALHGDQDTIGTVRDWAAVYNGLARNPRASAEYMAEHRDDVWEQMQVIGPVTSEEDFQAAFAAFLHSATIDSRAIYARLGLNDENQANLAEQNAAFVIEKVGTLEEPFPFFDAYRVVFTDITEEYWDDLAYSMSQPAGVSDNPDRDGIEVNADAWQKFVTEGMRNPECAARLHEMMSTWYHDYIDSAAGSRNGNEHYWDDMMALNMAGMFSESWETVLGEIEADEAAREAFIGSLVDAGFNLIPPDPQAIIDMGKEQFIGALKNTITSAIVGATQGEGPPELDYSFHGTHHTWVATAVAEFNAINGDGRPFPTYNDGDVTWEADPHFYEELYGGDFTDGDTIIPPYDDKGNQNPDFPWDDPNALHAFNQWLQDPAMQVYLGENKPGIFTTPR